MNDDIQKAELLTLYAGMSSDQKQALLKKPGSWRASALAAAGLRVQ